jgi:multidrug resistance efflux pump
VFNEKWRIQLDEVSKMLSSARVPFWLILLMGVFVFAHEGHKPLPTKGIELDLHSGSIVLTEDAYRQLDVAAIELKPLAEPQTAFAYATIIPDWQGQVFVGSPIAGRLSSAPTLPGSQVEINTLLAQIESPELERLRRDWRNAKLELRLAEDNLARLDSLGTSQAVPERDRIEAISRRNQAVGAIQVLNAKWLSLGVLVDSSESQKWLNDPRPLRLPIYSPKAGRVYHNDLVAGAAISAGDHLFEIVDLDELWVEINILEEHLPKLRKDTPIRLDIIGSEKGVFDGDSSPDTNGRASLAVNLPVQLDILPMSISSATGTAKAWARLAEPSKLSDAGGTESPFSSKSSIQLLPGMAATANIDFTEQGSWFEVPEGSVCGLKDANFVLVEVAVTKKSMEYRREPVKIGFRRHGMVAIQGSQLLPGDRVIERGAQVLGGLFLREMTPRFSFKESLIRMRAKSSPSSQLKSLSSKNHSLRLPGQWLVPATDRGAISSPLDGWVTKLMVRPGEMVSVGDPLLEVQSLALQDLQLELIQAEINRRFWEDQGKRLLQLQGSEVSAKRRLAEIQTKLDVENSTLAATREILLNYGYTSQAIDEVATTQKLQSVLVLKASHSGTVVEANAKIGKPVLSDQVLVEIHDRSKWVVRGFASQSQAQRLRIGQRCTISSNQFTTGGLVVRLGPQSTDDGSTYDVWIEPDQLPPAWTVHEGLATIEIAADADSQEQRK